VAGSTPGVTPISDNSAVFNPNVAAISAGSTYDPFGLPTGMGKQRIYVGYLPHTSEAQTYGGQYSEKQMDPSNSEVTVEDLLKHYHDLATSSNPASRSVWAQTQAQLQAMNAYNADKRINYGTWGTSDAAALKDAITGYMQGGDASRMMTFEEYVKQASAQGAANGLDENQPGGPGTAKAQAPQYTLATAQDKGDAVAQAELGHSLTSDQAGTLQGALNDNSAGAFANGQNDDPSSFARNWLVQNNMTEYKAHQATAYMNAFLNLIGGSGTAANVGVGDVAVG
jgi:hypothetical protein